MTKVKSIIKSVIPSVILSSFSAFKKKGIKHKGQIAWSGQYSSWLEAKNHCLGYESENILDRCKNSLLKVKRGEAIYERDSVIFDRIQYPWPLLTSLQDILITNNNQLRLIDFGGSLGSTFFQNKLFLKKILHLKWFVVEQPHFVDIGKKEFEDEQLKFEYTIDEVLEKSEIDCILFSSVLGYLDNPYKWVDKFMEKGFQYIIIDRTGFIQDNQRLTVQTVEEPIYNASYPFWFFNEKEFLDYFLTKYDLIVDFKSYIEIDKISDDKKHLYWKGFYMKRKIV